MKIKKVVVILLVCALLSSTIFALVACNKGENWKDKAIIYVTALFAGGLYDEDTGDAKWEPFDTPIDAQKVMNGEMGVEEVLGAFEESGENVVQIAADALNYVPGGLLYDLTLDNDGIGYNDNIVPATNVDMDINYGAFGLYKPFVDNISAVYGDDYDVFVYNQDWRKSPAVSAKALEELINHRGYDEVVFLSHSMGAPVVNNYLARSEENRNKVKLYMGFAPATLGSFDALAALACPDVYVNNFLDGMNLDDEMMATVQSIVGNVLDTALGDFFRNNQGLMALVPSWQLVSSDQYSEEYPAITVDGEAITTKEELYNLYSSMRWAKYLVPKSEEETKKWDYDGISHRRVEAQEGQPADKDGYRLKDFAANLDEYFDNMFIDGKIASESINSYYYLGTGNQNTITGLKLTTRRDDNGDVMYDAYGCVLYNYELLTGYGNVLGDGTVPYYSSIGGNTATAEYISALGDRLVTFEGQNHGTVGLSWDLLGEHVMNLLATTLA